MNHPVRPVLRLLSAAFIACAVMAAGCAVPSKTKVLVVGTIHQRHGTDTNYTYSDIVRILSAFDPDIIGVEIRPADFRREPYLEEMMLAVIWGDLHGKKVYPVDWWTDAGVRRVRDSLGALPEYAGKAERLKGLEADDSIMTRFERKYGSWKDQAQQGYGFWNGREYGEYIAEDYRLSMEVYGDSPFNLFYRTRNDSMMALILGALRENPGRRAVILTGGEHKHYFDRALRESADIDVVDLGTLLPLRAYEPEPAIRAFLEDADDLPYFAQGCPGDMNAYFRAKLIPLIHGPDMDFDPDIVPPRNVSVARKIMQRWAHWRASGPESDTMVFENGWMAFLEGKYDSAIACLQPLASRIEAGTVPDPFLRAMTHRNLGFCYDCVGERQKAVSCYERGEQLLRDTPFRQASKMVFQDHHTRPYRRGKR